MFPFLLDVEHTSFVFPAFPSDGHQLFYRMSDEWKTCQQAVVAHDILLSASKLIEAIAKVHSSLPVEVIKKMTTALVRVCAQIDDGTVVQLQKDGNDYSLRIPAKGDVVPLVTL